MDEDQRIDDELRSQIAEEHGSQIAEELTPMDRSETALEMLRTLEHEFRGELLSRRQIGLFSDSCGLLRRIVRGFSGNTRLRENILGFMDGFEETALNDKQLAALTDILDDGASLGFTLNDGFNETRSIDEKGTSWTERSTERESGKQPKSGL
ncbi:hypothetical protein [Roseimaritima multifibrata]|nr:hypothetical protein [Roseimaritima multifibrata]